MIYSIDIVCELGLVATDVSLYESDYFCLLGQLMSKKMKTKKEENKMS